MTKIEMMRNSLSPVTLAALAHQAGEYPGFVVQTNPADANARVILAELRVHGVVGANDGLTVMGSGLTAMLRAELMDSLF